MTVLHRTEGESQGVLSGKTRQAGPEALISGSSFPMKFEGGTFHFSLAVYGVPDEGRENLLQEDIWPGLHFK